MFNFPYFAGSKRCTKRDTLRGNWKKKKKLCERTQVVPLISGILFQRSNLSYPGDEVAHRRLVMLCCFTASSPFRIRKLYGRKCRTIGCGTTARSLLDFVIILQKSLPATPGKVTVDMLKENSDDGASYPEKTAMIWVGKLRAVQVVEGQHRGQFFQ